MMNDGDIPIDPEDEAYDNLRGIAKVEAEQEKTRQLRRSCRQPKLRFPTPDPKPNPNPTSNSDVEMVVLDSEDESGTSE